MIFPLKIIFALLITTVELKIYKNLFSVFKFFSKIALLKPTVHFIQPLISFLNDFCT